MAGLMNRQIIVKKRPVGMPRPEDFELVETPVRPPGENEVLRHAIYLSLDPYQRGRLRAEESYAPRAEEGQVMVGDTVSQVIESHDPRFRPGDFVVGRDGWQEYCTGDASGLRKIDPSLGPLSYSLGVLGMPGMTAYVALLDVGKPKAGETVVVSAASGAVGSVAGQIAKIIGCRVVGVAGSKEKCDYVVQELGFDACLNYKTEDLTTALREACPEGIDVYFDNVAGDVLAAVMKNLHLGARIILVGLISEYNADPRPPGPNLHPLLVKRASITGFLVGDHKHRQEAFLNDVSRWLKEDKIKYREHIVEGLENAPAVFPWLFEGKNFGKLIVKIREEPKAGD